MFPRLHFLNALRGEVRGPAAALGWPRASMSARAIQAAILLAEVLEAQNRHNVDVSQRSFLKIISLADPDSSIEPSSNYSSAKSLRSRRLTTPRIETPDATRIRFPSPALEVDRLVESHERPALSRDSRKCWRIDWGGHSRVNSRCLRSLPYNLVIKEPRQMRTGITIAVFALIACRWRRRWTLIN